MLPILQGGVQMLERGLVIIFFFFFFFFFYCIPLPQGDQMYGTMIFFPLPLILA